ncbi:50S ribosomal protein L14e [Candidatus Woesearchaeota archaeon]|nr:50S ribosomal protein L14e [Candidatus Woesearchaeota archaeon]
MQQVHAGADQGDNPMIEVGRVMVKTAGRDAGLRGVVVDILDERHVLIDGQVRRRKCNIAHMEPLPEQVSISKGASHEQVREALQKLGMEVAERKAKPVEKQAEAKEKPGRKKGEKKAVTAKKKSTSAAKQKAR